MRYACGWYLEELLSWRCGKRKLRSGWVVLSNSSVSILVIYRVLSAIYGHGEIYQTGKYDGRLKVRAGQRREPRKRALVCTMDVYSNYYVLRHSIATLKSRVESQATIHGLEPGLLEIKCAIGRQLAS